MEEIMLEFEVLSRHNSEGTEENCKNNSDAIPGLWAEILIKHAIHSSTKLNNVNTLQNIFKSKEICQYIHMHNAYKTKHKFGQIMMALWSVRF